MNCKYCGTEMLTGGCPNWKCPGKVSTQYPLYGYEPKDFEITSLRADIARLTRERDAAREALQDILRCEIKGGLYGALARAEELLGWEVRKDIDAALAEAGGIAESPIPCITHPVSTDPICDHEWEKTGRNERTCHKCGEVNSWTERAEAGRQQRK